MMPQKRMECFRLLSDHLAWIEHQFLSGIRDLRKAGSQWGMIRGVGGLRKSINQSWLAKGLGLGLLCWGLREFRKRFLGKKPTLFKSGQWHFLQDNAPVHNSILVTDYLTKMGIKTVFHPPYRPGLAPCDFCLFPKLRGCRYQTGDISTLNDRSLKLVDKFTYLRSSVSSTETDINTWLAKAWTATNRLLVIWKSDLTDKIKRSFFQAAVVSILLYECTAWTLTKRMEKNLDSNYRRMLRTILNKSWRQHPTK